MPTTSLTLRLFTLLFVVSLAACGGGGGGASSTPDVTVPSPYPTLIQTPTFTLPTLPVPPERITVAGNQQGRVFTAPDVAAVAGLVVDWLDASVPAAPRVLGSAQTRSDGTFTISANAGAVAPVDQWVRVRLQDGTLLRAFATGWVEVTPGTEAAVREIGRLRVAGAFTAHVLAIGEIAAAQESATLSWSSTPASQLPAVAADAHVEKLRYLASWNALFNTFSLSGVSEGSGDIAGLMPVGEVLWPSTTHVNGVTVAATFQSSCFSQAGVSTTSCSIQSIYQPELGETYTKRASGLGRFPSYGPSKFQQALVQVGELPLIEFPYAVGTKLLYSNSTFTLASGGAVRAAIRITRRTYPVEATAALGDVVMAVKVALDFEVALLDVASGEQTDVLMREVRWFSPGNGRVRFEGTTLKRSARRAAINNDSVPILTDSFTVSAQSVNGAVFAEPVIPFAGVADIRALGLRHRHAVYSPLLNRIYAAVPMNGGQILELDPESLSTLRSLSTGGVPGRLAVSADGKKLYAGLDGGALAQWRTDDFSLAFRTVLPVDPNGEQYRRVYDLSVDPFDANRVVVLAGGTSFGGSGALLIYRQGVLVLRDAPRYYATDYGWGGYSPNAVAWSTTTPNEYVAASLGSPRSVYRFRADEIGGVNTDVAALTRVDDVGWKEVDGNILTDRGQSLDAFSFAPRGELIFSSAPLAQCRRQDATTTNTDLCKVAGNYAYIPPIYVRLDHATSVFLGTYRPALVDIANGCAAGSLQSDAVVLSNPVLTPMSASRSLVSSWDAGSADELCSLQVWTLHGVP